MKKNFHLCLEQVLMHEGGWSDRKDDPGGATMKGVTLLTYRRFYGSDKTKEALRRISPDELSHIYHAGYWEKNCCDDLPAGVDLAVFDSAVNSGPKQSAKWLQAVVGVVQDGHIGPDTMSKTRAIQGDIVIHGICDHRLSFLRSLSTWPVFGNGWQRRVEQVKAFALVLFQGSVSDQTDLSPAENFITVGKGARGKWVVEVQKILGVEADGIFGPKTEKALKMWQADRGLEPDGIAGRNTYRAMGLI